MSGTNLVKTGRVAGTGSAIKIHTGFKPRKVELYNDDSGDSAVKTDSMPSDEAFKRVAAGTATTPGSVCTLEDDGFTIGTDSDLNASGENIDWVAWQAEND